MSNKLNCCLCGEEILSEAFSHNPYPLVEQDDYESRCCGSCNDLKVLPSRMEMLRGNTKAVKEGWFISNDSV